MILENAIPRLREAMDKTILTGKSQEVTFIYQELNTHDTVTSAFAWMYNEGYNFSTRSDEHRYVIIVHPRKQNG